ncbi:MAG: AI-2E family transporter [Euryarchaeota archaeon]|nr:AI-2E family transporter [Euryarchaeota archaeon]
MMRRKMNTTFLILLLVALGWVSYLIIEPFLGYIVGGLLLTFVFYPLYKRLLGFIRNPGASSFLAVVLIILIIVLPVIFAVWSLIQDVTELTEDVNARDIEGFLAELDAGIARLTGFEFGAGGNETAPTSNQTADPGGGDNNTTAGKKGFLQPGDFTRFVMPQIERIGREIVAQSLTFVFNAVLGIFVMLFIMYYGFKDGISFRDFVYATVPLRETYKDKLFEELREVVDAVFIGQIFVSIIQGVLGGLGFWVFGIPNAFFWGFVMTLLAILPIIGTPLVWLPAGLIELALGNTFAGVGIIIYGAVIVSTVDNFLKPKIIGDRAEVHPAIVLLGVVGGLAFFGFIGFLMGPLILAIFTVLLKLFQADFVSRSEVSTPEMGKMQ